MLGVHFNKKAWSFDYYLLLFAFLSVTGFIFLKYVALQFGSDLLEQYSHLFPKGLDWPWWHQLLLLFYAAIVGLCYRLLIHSCSRGERYVQWFGFTTKQNSGSHVFALKILLLLLAYRFVFASLLGGDDGSTDIEELLFIFLSYGVVGEVFFHGILLAACSSAINSPKISMSNVKLGGAELLVIVLSSVSLSISYFNGVAHLHAHGLVTTGVMGICLLWLRLKTGSLLYPVVVHSVVVLFAQLL